MIESKMEMLKAIMFSIFRIVHISYIDPYNGQVEYTGSHRVHAGIGSIDSFQ